MVHSPSLVVFYHLVLEGTTALVYPPHKPPSSPLNTPAKVSFIHFWQTLTTTGWTGLKMPGGNLMKACLRIAFPRQ